MNYLEARLKFLKESLNEMAELVISQLKNSMEALISSDRDLANQVIRNERTVNGFELKIDKDCEHIFTLLAPVAQDMRFVFATLKINADLERIADYAEGIANLALLGDMKFDKTLVKDLELNKMSSIAIKMLQDVNEAYREENADLARSLFTTDKLLNNINHNATDTIVNYCRKEPEHIPQALYLLSIIRKLERAGDHITNIAEDIIFYLEATVLKHGDKLDDNDEFKTNKQ